MALGAVEEDLLTVGAVAGVGGETQHCKQLLDQPTREFGFCLPNRQSEPALTGSADVAGVLRDLHGLLADLKHDRVGLLVLGGACHITSSQLR